MKISFYGAAQNVTGSKHLIETNGLRILLDCGMHQGKRSEANRLNQTLPFPASSIDVVILSHGHLDHCGMLPVLIRNGYSGKIYCTSATADIARSILNDSASIQQQDAEYFNRHHPKEPIEPIYTLDDVARVTPHFAAVPYFRNDQHWITLRDTVRFKLLDAGHILGSAIIVIEVVEHEQKKYLAFTGDIGQAGTPLLFSPEPITEQLDALLMESTYGGVNHKPLSTAIDELVRIIHQAVAQKSKIIVPAFSLGRTQEIIYILHKLTDEKKIPPLPIYIDSPLATSLVDIFLKHANDFDQETWKDFTQFRDQPFTFSNLHYTHSVEESKELNNMSGPMMIIAASGMSEGGRILHHLKNNIADPNAIILITGYQAEATLGRKIQDGMSPIKIYNEPYDVRAHIVTINEFSAHADQQALLTYVASIAIPKNIYLVHGEAGRADVLEHVLVKKYPTCHVSIPAMGQSAEI